MKKKNKSLLKCRKLKFNTHELGLSKYFSENYSFKVINDKNNNNL